MQNIRNIIFDLGGVILNLDNQRTEEAFVSMGVKKFRELFGLGYAASFFKEYEVGKIDDRQFVESLKELAARSVSGSDPEAKSGVSQSGITPAPSAESQTGAAPAHSVPSQPGAPLPGETGAGAPQLISDETVIEAWNAMLADFPPERIALLDELKTRYRIFLFSNTNALHLAALNEIYQAAFPGKKLDDHFEKAYYSHLLGMRKPTRESYEYILRENNLRGAETLFVDDALVNIEGANAAGLQGFYLKPGMSILDIEW